MDLNSVEFRIADIIPDDSIMQNATPTRKMFSTIDTRNDGVSFSTYNKISGMRTMRALAKAVKKRKLDNS